MAKVSQARVLEVRVAARLRFRVEQEASTEERARYAQV